MSAEPEPQIEPTPDPPVEAYDDPIVLSLADPDPDPNPDEEADVHQEPESDPDKDVALAAYIARQYGYTLTREAPAPQEEEDDETDWEAAVRKAARAEALKIQAPVLRETLLTRCTAQAPDSLAARKYAEQYVNQMSDEQVAAALSNGAAQVLADAAYGHAARQSGGSRPVGRASEPAPTSSAVTVTLSGDQGRMFREYQSAFPHLSQSEILERVREVFPR